jgi:hypothetical protein
LCTCKIALHENVLTAPTPSLVKSNLIKMNTEENNFAVFRDTLSGALTWRFKDDIKKRARKSKRRERKAKVVSEESQPSNTDLDDLTDFIDVRRILCP